MNFLKTYELPLSIWDMILDNVAQSELYEVKLTLGEDLVDQNEELRSEIKTLLEINCQLDREKCAGDVNNFLPEPPEMRERLLKEIQFFVASIREQSKLHGRDPDCLLSARSKDIMDYAYESANSSLNSGPLTSDTSNFSTSRSSYRASPISDRSSNIVLLKEKLNYIDFDEVKGNLKQFLQDEVNQLFNDLEHIHVSLCGDGLDIESSRNGSVIGLMKPPTISELRTERRELERILITETTRPSTSNSSISSASSRSLVNGSNVGPPKQKKPLFQLRPNEVKLPNSSSGVVGAKNHIKSPPKLCPIEPSQTQAFSSSVTHIESPLDFGLPETDSCLSEIINETNNNHTQSTAMTINIPPSSASSSISSLSPLNSPRSIRPPVHPVKTNIKYNSAQKFRQKILQNRKETYHS